MDFKSLFYILLSSYYIYFLYGYVTIPYSRYISSNKYNHKSSIIPLNQYTDNNQINSIPIFPPPCLLTIGLTEQQLEIIDNNVFIEQSIFSNYPVIIIDKYDMKKPLEYFLDKDLIESRDHIIPTIKDMNIKDIDIPLIIFSGINQSNFPLFIDIVSKIRKNISSIMFATVVNNALKKTLDVLYLEIRNDHNERKSINK